PHRPFALCVFSAVDPIKRFSDDSSACRDIGGGCLYSVLCHGSPLKTVGAKMTRYDFAFKVLEPVLPYIFGAALLWFVLKITDQSFNSLISGIWSELRGVIEGQFINLRGVNAIGVFLLFLLAIFLFHGKLGDILVPTHRDLAHDAIYAVVFVFFG